MNEIMMRSQFDEWMENHPSYLTHGFNRREDMWEAWKAAGKPPEGHVLAPAEPTEEMLLAAKTFQCDHSDEEDWMEWDGAAAANQYRRMIAARPGGTDGNG